jgi:phosphate acetyltransferase
MEDGSYFGTMMVYKGDADGMVSGQHIQHLLRSCRFAIHKKRNQIQVVSSIFLCA